MPESGQYGRLELESIPDIPVEEWHAGLRSLWNRHVAALLCARYHSGLPAAVQRHQVLHVSQLARQMAEVSKTDGTAGALHGVSSRLHGCVYSNRRRNGRTSALVSAALHCSWHSPTRSPGCVRRLLAPLRLSRTHLEGIQLPTALLGMGFGPSCHGSRLLQGVHEAARPAFRVCRSGVRNTDHRILVLPHRSAQSAPPHTLCPLTPHESPKRV